MSTKRHRRAGHFDSGGFCRCGKECCVADVTGECVCAKCACQQEPKVELERFSSVFAYSGTYSTCPGAYSAGVPFLDGPVDADVMD